MSLFNSKQTASVCCAMKNLSIQFTGSTFWYVSTRDAKQIFHTSTR
jgi:hypothetical protein